MKWCSANNQPILERDIDRCTKPSGNVCQWLIDIDIDKTNNNHKNNNKPKKKRDGKNK